MCVGVLLGAWVRRGSSGTWSLGAVGITHDDARWMETATSLERSIVFQFN
jgi:hypothetical protein